MFYACGYAFAWTFVQTYCEVCTRTAFRWLEVALTAEHDVGQDD